MFQELLPALTAYFAYLVIGLLLLALFILTYLKVTVVDEISLIRQGYLAPMLSFGGALIGFALTLCSSAMHTNTLVLFLTWGLLAGLVQILVYYVVSHCVKGLADALNDNNIAMGALLGFVSVSVGILNAGCLS
ncbi:DUF350 domain-containing protein [Formosimonas limnophila]|uniref:DUF350 domain-containing protein n=1 Tax=Formosimonas limnophila TaxID=1384487 RepID=A0A8J3CKA2_9BURK|nr:DUF350 domain-containing protein [Formosimonas limnophila]GHA68472.1 DUF350 domain-containing protein [Formosimonas limnophila]